MLTPPRCRILSRSAPENIQYGINLSMGNSQSCYRSDAIGGLAYVSMGIFLLLIWVDVNFKSKWYFIGVACAALFRESVLLLLALPYISDVNELHNALSQLLSDTVWCSDGGHTVSRKTSRDHTMHATEERQDPNDMSSSSNDRSKSNATSDRRDGPISGVPPSNSSTILTSTVNIMGDIEVARKFHSNSIFEDKEGNIESDVEEKEQEEDSSNIRGLRLCLMTINKPLYMTILDRVVKKTEMRLQLTTLLTVLLVSVVSYMSRQLFFAANN